MAADVNTQSRSFHVALREHRHRDAWTAGRQLLAACDMAIGDLREQSERRRARLPWSRRVFTAVVDHDTDAIAHYQEIGRASCRERVLS